MGLQLLNPSISTICPTLFTCGSPLQLDRTEIYKKTKQSKPPKPNKSRKSWLLVADLKALAEKDGRKLGCRTTTSGRESSLGTGRSLLPSPQIPLSTEETKGGTKGRLGMSWGLCAPPIPGALTPCRPARPTLTRPAVLWA